MEKERLIDFPKILDDRGNLSFMESEQHIPFKIQRVYWIYDVPGGEYRGGHAYKMADEVIIALSGSFEVMIDNGIEKKMYTLNRSYNGIYVPRMNWRMLQNFSTNSLALVLSSTAYTPADYLRNYSEYKSIVDAK